MRSSKIIKKYLTLTFSIIIAMTVIVTILERIGISIYGTVFGLVAIAIGGLSTAFAGAKTARYSGKIRSYKTILAEFFRIKESAISYLVIILFLFLMFSRPLLHGQLQNGRRWGELPILFGVAILFGGVEEIGWRYLFQPTLEKRFSFLVSSFITFGAWGVWHMMYFVIDGSIRLMRIEDVLSFVVSLLGTSFVLGCIYRITESLWLCVFYHALLNAFTQTFVGGGMIETIVIAAVSLVLSVLAVYLFAQKSTFKTNRRGQA